MTPTPIPASLAASAATLDAATVAALRFVLAELDETALAAIAITALEHAALLRVERVEREATAAKLADAHRAEIDAAVGQIATLTADRDDARRLAHNYYSRLTAVRVALVAAGAPQVVPYPADDTIDDHERSLRAGGRAVALVEMVSHLTADRDDLAARVRELEAESGNTEQLRCDVRSDPALECSMPISEQFAELTDLADGWLDGEGAAYAPAFLDTAERLVRYMVEVVGLPVPFLYPTADGDIRVEWPSPRWEIVLRLSNDQQALLTACEVETKRYIEQDCSTRQRADWDRVGTEIERLLREDDAK